MDCHHLTRGRFSAALAVALCGLLSGAFVARPTHASEEDAGDPAPSETIRVSVDYPKGGEVGTWDDLGLVLGSALAYQGDFNKVDVMFCIDVSGSTAASSGVDVDGDGKVGGGLFSGGSSDSILALELAAVRKLLDKLDPRATRVGVVIYSGDQQRGTPDALLESELTRDYDRVRRVLDDIALVPPQGGTNMFEGLALATRELIGGRGARSKKRSRAQKLLIFLTDGVPTLPGNGQTVSRESVRKPIAVASRARKKGIRILSFGLGREATRNDEVTREIARITGGEYVALDELDGLIPQLETVEFLALEDIVVRNRTLDAPARCAFKRRNGRFAALLPLAAGQNTVEIAVEAESGERVTETLDVVRAASPGLKGLSDRQEKDLARLKELCRRPEPGERDRKLEIETEESDDDED